jgi:hypothetical protein
VGAPSPDTGPFVEPPARTLIRARQAERPAGTTDHCPNDWFRRNVWKPALSAAKIRRRVVFYDLRHTHATWLARSRPQRAYPQVNRQIRALSDHTSCGTQAGGVETIEHVPLFTVPVIAARDQLTHEETPGKCKGASHYRATDFAPPWKGGSCSSLGYRPSRR